MPSPSLWLISVVFALFSTFACGETCIVVDPDAAPPARHGLDAIVNALKAKNQTVRFVNSIDRAGDSVILTAVAGEKTEAAERFKSWESLRTFESLAIQKLKMGPKHVLLLAGADARGLMYAELDVADRIGWSEGIDPFSQVRETTESPDCRERAVSMYTMQRAYFEQRLYDAHYWDKYFDLLARDRFNSFVLIFGYENGGFLAPPYPYFFNVDGFPDVRMVGIAPEQQQKNLAALNRLIEQAHARGIDVTIGIWDHIYRGGVQANGVPGTQGATTKPTQGLVWGITADNLIPYTKAALTQFIREVHGIDAIQFRMHDESGLKKSEQGPFWREIAHMMQKEAPNIRFDARAKGLPDSVIDEIASTGIPLRVTTKYWMEQMGMPWHPTHINAQDQSNRRHSYADLLRYPRQYKMHWRLWNGGTSRVLLWGDPEYVKRFVESTHLYDGDGFEINEPLCTKMQGQAQDVRPFDLLKPQFKYAEYEFERYWYQLMLFGRLGYDPSTPAEGWDREFTRRFGKDAGPHIERALDRASWILPRIIAAVYPYSAFPMTRGWAERQPLGDLPHYAMNQGSDVAIFANFQEEVDSILGKAPTTKVLPSQTAWWFEQTADNIEAEIHAAVQAIPAEDALRRAMEEAGPHSAIEAYAQRATLREMKSAGEIRSTVNDLFMLDALARFHANRIRAALCWLVYQKTRDRNALAAAVRFEMLANDQWRELSVRGAPYNDDLMFGNPRFDLAGQWKDDVPALEPSLKALKKELENGPPTVDYPDSGPAALLLKRLAPHEASLFMQHEPVTQLAVGQPLKIDAQVASAAGIKWVRLRCRSVNQTLDYDVVPMNPTGNRNEYEAIVPADKISPRFDFMYYIEALDEDGHGAIFPDPEQRTPYVVVKLERKMEP